MEKSQLLDTEPRTASVTTITNCKLYALSQFAFYQMVMEHPKIMQGMIRLLVQRMRKQNESLVKAHIEREKELEKKVEERTQELQLSNAELKKAYAELNITTEKLHIQNEKISQQNQLLEQSLKTIHEQQKQIIQKEQMAELARIVPIVAHEINTPLSAIKIAIEFVDHILPKIVRQLPESNDKIPPEFTETFWKFIDLSLKLQTNYSSAEERKQKKKLEEELTRKNIPDAEEIATKLVKIGITESESIDEFINLFKYSEVASDIVEAAYLIGQLKKQLTTILGSSKKTQKIVDNLNTLVYKRPNAHEPIPTNIHENIQVIITLYEYYLAQAANLDLQFGKIPLVIAYPEDLYQVWTNLLTHALHCIKNNNYAAKGNISIHTQADAFYVYITIKDSGPSFKPQELEKTFNTDFDNKEQESDANIGLAISKNIIERHKGNIKIETKPPNDNTYLIQIPIDFRLLEDKSNLNFLIL